MRKTILLTVIIILGLTILGCEKKLSRSDAEKILNNSGLCATRTFTLEISIANMGEFSSDAESLRRLREAGIIDIEELRENDINYNFINPSIKFRVSVLNNTDFILVDNDKSIMQVMLAKYNNFKVTGIRKISENECEVEAISDATVTEPGKILNFSNTDNEGTYTFRYYDDGWRLIADKTI